MAAQRQSPGPNNVPDNFFARFRTAGDGETVFFPLAVGFLRLEYDDTEAPALLARVAFTQTATEHARPEGLVLECTLDPEGREDTVTFIAAEGVAGTQWADGVVRFGHTYEDGTPGTEGRRISLGAWVDECLQKMVNPGPEKLARIARGYDLADNMDKLRAGDDRARDAFWKRCAPRDGAEAGLVLELLAHAVRGDGDLLFACCDPLKRARAGQTLILEKVTALLEGGDVPADYDRTELQEVLRSHAVHAAPAVAERWLMLCRSAFRNKGPQLLQAINEGALLEALLIAPGTATLCGAFFRELLDTIMSQPAAARRELEGLVVHGKICKAVG